MKTRNPFKFGLLQTHNISPPGTQQITNLKALFYLSPQLLFSKL